MDVLVIAAHSDDEVLGMGATIRKLTNNNNTVRLCVISESASVQYPNNAEKMINIRKKSCLKSSKLLGISSIDFLDFPDMRLDTIPQLQINQKLE